MISYLIVLIYCINKCHKINFKWVRWYIDSIDWIRNKKATINPIIKKDFKKCFQYAITVELNHSKTGENAERITKIKPFIEKHNSEGMNYPSQKDD